MSPTTRHLLTVAAELRAVGHPWEAVAQRVQRQPKTCQHWPARFRDDWDRLYRSAQLKRFEEMSNEARTHLNGLMRHDDPKVKQKAVEVWLKCGAAAFGPQGGLVPAGPPDAGPPDRNAALLQQAKEQMAEARDRIDRRRAHEGLTPTTDREFMAEWDAELEALRPPREQPAGNLNDSGTPDTGPDYPGGLRQAAYGLLLLGGVLIGHFLAGGRPLSAEPVPTRTGVAYPAETRLVSGAAGPPGDGGHRFTTAVRYDEGSPRPPVPRPPMFRLLVCSLLAVPALAPAADPPKPQKPDGPLAEARQRWLRGNYAEARAAYEKLLEDDKLRAPAAIGVSRTWLSEGDPAKALSALEDAIQKDGKNADLLAARADVLFQSGQWDEASKDADAALKLSPEQFQARWVRACLLRDTGDVTKADAEMRWFVRTYTRRDNEDKPIQDPDELLLVGLAGAENARWHGLGDQFRFLINDLYPDVLKFDPDDWRAEWHIGVLLLEKYNRPEANTAFDNALKINPKAAEALVGKGAVALQQFETKEAADFADQALKINPRLPSALRLKADVLILAGEIAEARKPLDLARQVNPRDEYTLARIAACARVMNKPEEVAAVIAEVEKFNPKPGVLYHQLASALEDRKVYGDAETYFKKSVELRDKLPAAKAGLGMLYLRLGKEAEARALLEQAFKGDTFNVRVSNSLKVLRHLEKYETIQTKHYDLRYDPKTDKLLAEFMAEYLETTHAQLTKDFQYEPKDRILVELFNNHEMFSGRTVGLPDLHTIGACTGKVVTIASPKGKGLVKPFNWGRVIRHELVHIFNLAQTDFQVPHWLTEGLAVRNEGGNRPPQWSAVLRDRFEKDDLLNLDNILLAFVRPRNQEEWSLAYCQSNLYVEYLIKTHGIESVGPMLNAYREGLETGAAIRKVCGVDKAAFEKGYKAYVTEVVKAIPSGKRAAEKPMTLAELEKAHEKDPGDAEVSARLADQYSRRKRAADARKLAEGVLEKQPGHPLASIVKARLLSAAGDEDAARQVIEAATKANPDDPKLLLSLGRLAVEAKDWPKAAELFERGRKTAPVDGDWLPVLVEVYTETGDSDKLADVLREQVGNDPDDLKNRVKLAKLLSGMGKYAEAEEAALDAIRIDVTDAEAQKALLEALDGAKKADEAAALRKRFGPAPE